MATAPPRVLSVGQCGFDHGAISRHLEGAFGARVVDAATATEALATLRDRNGPAERFDLVLVNRVGNRDGARGVDLIRTMKDDPKLADLPVMLVSNYPDAQAEAVGLGALPGFGKADLRTDEARRRIAEALGNRPGPA